VSSCREHEVGATTKMSDGPIAADSPSRVAATTGVLSGTGTGGSRFARRASRKRVTRDQRGRSAARCTRQGSSCVVAETNTTQSDAWPERVRPPRRDVGRARIAAGAFATRGEHDRIAANGRSTPTQAAGARAQPEAEDARAAGGSGRAESTNGLQRV